jgi:hypothetical protein
VPLRIPLLREELPSLLVSLRRRRKEDKNVPGYLNILISPPHENSTTWRRSMAL